jgi:hypothetical protein
VDGFACCSHGLEPTKHSLQPHPLFLSHLSGWRDSSGAMQDRNKEIQSDPESWRAPRGYGRECAHPVLETCSSIYSPTRSTTPLHSHVYSSFIPSTQSPRLRWWTCWPCRRAQPMQEWHPSPHYRQKPRVSGWHSWSISSCRSCLSHSVLLIWLTLYSFNHSLVLSSYSTSLAFFRMC